MLLSHVDSSTFCQPMAATDCYPYVVNSARVASRTLRDVAQRNVWEDTDITRMWGRIHFFADLVLC